MPEDDANIYENKCGLTIWGPRLSVTWGPWKGVMVSCVCGEGALSPARGPCASPSNSLPEGGTQRPLLSTGS